MTIKFIEQRIKHNPPHANGDCWIACLANLTGIDYEKIPQFQNTDDWASADMLCRQWLSENGYTLNQHKVEEPPAGYSMAIGESPRFPGVGHVVIAFDDAVVFDPHPEKTGVCKIWFYETIAPASV